MLGFVIVAEILTLHHAQRLHLPPEPGPTDSRCWATNLGHFTNFHFREAKAGRFAR